MLPLEGLGSRASQRTQPPQLKDNSTIFVLLYSVLPFLCKELRRKKGKKKTKKKKLTQKNKNPILCRYSRTTTSFKATQRKQPPSIISRRGEKKNIKVYGKSPALLSKQQRSRSEK